VHIGKHQECEAIDVGILVEVVLKPQSSAVVPRLQALRGPIIHIDDLRGVGEDQSIDMELA